MSTRSTRVTLQRYDGNSTYINAYLDDLNTNSISIYIKTITFIYLRPPSPTNIKITRIHFLFFKSHHHQFTIYIYIHFLRSTMSQANTQKKNSSIVHVAPLTDLNDDLLSFNFIREFTNSALLNHLNCRGRRLPLERGGALHTALIE